MTHPVFSGPLSRHVFGELLGDRCYGVLLANHSLVEFVFHLQQLLSFLFRQLVHRNSGPDRKHFSYRFFIYFIEKSTPSDLICSINSVRRSRFFSSSRNEPASSILIFDCLFFLFDYFCDLVFNLFVVRWRLHSLYTSTNLLHQ